MQILRFVAMLLLRRFSIFTYTHTTPYHDTARHYDMILRHTIEMFSPPRHYFAAFITPPLRGLIFVYCYAVVATTDTMPHAAACC